MRKVTFSRMRDSYAQTVLTFRVTYVFQTPYGLNTEVWQFPIYNPFMQSVHYQHIREDLKLSSLRKASYVVLGIVIC